MKCLKCGLEIDDNSKFCGYCGNPVETPVNPTPVTNEVLTNVEPNNDTQENNVVVNQYASTEQPVFSSPVPATNPTPVVNDIFARVDNNVVSTSNVEEINQPVINEQPIVSEGYTFTGDGTVVAEPEQQSKIEENKAPVILETFPNVKDDSVNVSNVEEVNQPVINEQPVENILADSVSEEVPTPINNEINVQNNLKQKKGFNKWTFIGCGIALVLLAVVLIFMAFNKSSTRSIDAVEKALSNIVNKGQDSGTVVVNISMEDANENNIDLTGSLKYQKIDGAYNLVLVLNKSVLFDEIDLYGNITNDSINLYAKSNLIDMFITGITSEKAEWLKLSVKDLKLDLSETVSRKVDLSGFDKKIKLVSKGNGISHYELTVDNELLEIIKSKEQGSQVEGLSDLTTNSFEKPIYVYLDINNNNELEKISIDLSDYIEDESVSSAKLTIEFKDFGSTVVSIPNEALKATKDFETYMTEIMSKSQQLYFQ